MLRFVALSLIVAGLSNAAVFKQNHREAKGVWNFQWNFGEGGVLPPPQNATAPALPPCAPVQGCVNQASCMMGPMMTMQCNTMQEPNVMCYSSPPDPTTCEVSPAIGVCACEAEWSNPMPTCATVPGCLMAANCAGGPPLMCNRAAEPGTQCYSMSNPPSNCNYDPAVPWCACDSGFY